MEKKLTILGSTGSIGTQALDVARQIKGIEIHGLAAHGNIDLLESQAREFRPGFVAVMDEKKAAQLRGRLADTNTKVLAGMDGLLEISTLPAIDMVLNAVVGNIGLRPTIAAIQSKKNIALANKETLVTAGALVMKLAAEHQISLYPVDSEHSAIFQCLQGNEGNRIEKIYLTASGGPFRGKNKEALRKVTLAEALRHPKWNMGRKITVDSATLMNKGLEVIEAKWLFDLDLSQIEVLVHPQSVIHSMVEYEDGSVMAQLGEPDMRLPIQYALTYPKRVKNNFAKIDFLANNHLTFERPDLESFPCLSHAMRAIQAGGLLPTVLNGANETAVSLFLEGKIQFLDIPLLIEKAMASYNVKSAYTVEGILEADRWARSFVEENWLHICNCR